MTPTDHIRKAEELLDTAASPTVEDYGVEYRCMLYAAASAHAQVAAAMVALTEAQSRRTIL